jgi:predicted DNA-binding transcriptional regulator AlpA
MSRMPAIGWPASGGATQHNIDKGWTPMSDEPRFPEKLICSFPEAEEMCGCSRRHLKRLIEAGKFPKPFNFGGLVKFRVSDIKELFEKGGLEA